MFQVNLPHDTTLCHDSKISVHNWSIKFLNIFREENLVLFVRQTCRLSFSLSSILSKQIKPNIDPKYEL